MISSCLLAVAALAQGPDTIGLWFDTDYDVNVMPVPVAVPFQAYLVLHEPGAESVVGASFAVGFDSANLIVLASEWTGDPVVQVVDDCTNIGYGTPRPAEPAMLLNILTFLALTDGLVLFHVLPCAGQPCAYYLPPSLEPVCLATPFPDGVVACLGCEVEAQESTWTSVKSLYR